MSRAGLAVLLGCVLMMVALVVPGMQANAADGDQVCTGLDSGKIDVPGDQTSVTVTAPAGYLIDQYCVKAGSVQNGNGPVYVTVNPPQKTVTISYPGGKAVSHYSVSYVPVTPPTTPPPSTTTTHTTPPTSTTTKHTTPPPSTSTTHTSPSGTTTTAAAPVSTVTTYPLQPVNAGATSDNAVSPSTTNRLTVIGLALLALLALVGGRRLLQIRLDRPGSRRE
ncbi:MAG TPA: hypothetical protein VFT68_04825 [Lapillicoccus sp.]|nr:hypothetical protein [Lapillicoccus sp.]